MKPKLHLVYPHRELTSAPDVIGWKMADFFSKNYEVKLYQWDDKRTIVPKKGEILLGHPHPMGGRIFRNSMKQPEWEKVIAISPYTPSIRLSGFLGETLPYVDHYLAITGNYWAQRVGEDLFARYEEKFTHIDLAVDREHFPRLERELNPVGARRFLFIGSGLWCKNVPYLGEIAGAYPKAKFSWIGRGKYQHPNLHKYGFTDLSTSEGREIVAQYDFLIMPGRIDANPTTILEAMSWGLIPVCTRQSGYDGFGGIFNIPLDDVAGAVKIIDDLSKISESEYQACQELNFQLLENHFHWNRFLEQVGSALERKPSQSRARPDLKDRLTSLAGHHFGLCSPWRDLARKALRRS
ncbi:hypothetical protein OAF33_00730 [bacterium]|nr:hypothetical protein [bacterium]MDB4754138.1 hypothetical protein [Akkermansiaceae bacterium]